MEVNTAEYNDTHIRLQNKRRLEKILNFLRPIEHTKNGVNSMGTTGTIGPETKYLLLDDRKDEWYQIEENCSFCLNAKARLNMNYHLYINGLKLTVIEFTPQTTQKKHLSGEKSQALVCKECTLKTQDILSAIVENRFPLSLDESIMTINYSN